ncbi:MAG: hypothetical protein ACRDRT_02685 [Pseudonocardiaceae bacterium]
MELLPGLYLPLSFLRLLLNDERIQGPKGGVYLGYEHVGRHIDNTIFLQLTKEGWIGSSGVSIETIGKIANGSLANGHEVIRAIDRSTETPKQRQQRNRLITDEGVAFDSDTATGMMPVAHRVAGVLAFRRS